MSPSALPVLQLRAPSVARWQLFCSVNGQCCPITLQVLPNHVASVARSRCKCCPITLQVKPDWCASIARSHCDWAILAKACLFLLNYFLCHPSFLLAPSPSPFGVSGEKLPALFISLCVSVLYSGCVSECKRQKSLTPSISLCVSALCGLVQANGKIRKNKLRVTIGITQ